MKKSFNLLNLSAILVLSVLLSVSAALAAENQAEIIKLPEPEKTGGIGVLDAIANRRSAGDFKDVEISLQDLSTLLWAAGGVNRENGKLTYATAMNNQDMIIFVFTKSGVCRYNPKEHNLTLITAGDYRALTGRQAFVSRAAVDLLYIQDTTKWTRKAPAEDILNCGFSHAGLSMQNVYLYAASKGWGARTRMNFDREKLKELLNLNDKYNFTLMQCVGPEAEK